MESLSALEIVLGLLLALWIPLAAAALVIAPSWALRTRLGLYGRIYESALGVVGVFIVVFWFATALFAAEIALIDPLAQNPFMRFKPPGAISERDGFIYLLGSDNFGRDVFSRMVYGSQIVLVIAPTATLIAFLVGITLGLPAGYFGGWIDNALSFIANLVLAFPVIVIFYLLVTPDIAKETIIPQSMAGFFFLFPIVFFMTLFFVRFNRRPSMLAPLLLATLLFGGWVYVGMVFDADPLGVISVEPNELNIFIAVVFASSPGVFRIVRGLALDIRTRDYVAAAQTRGEGAWYIMLWEMLPNARGPLIVDACLRIGYTTILLGTLGFFGLGLASESPDWGTTIKDMSQHIRRVTHPILPPALALMSFVLGLNLLADALREQSLKD